MILTGKILSSMLVVMLSMFSLVSCDDSKRPGFSPLHDEQKETVENVETSGFTEYDTELIKFMSAEKSGENFSVSPLSIKYAMGMATAGAAGDTQKELINASDMGSLEVYNNWAKDYSEYVSECNKDWAEVPNWMQKYEESAEKQEYKISNSLWKVSKGKPDKNGFNAQYVNDMAKYYGSEVSHVTLDAAAEKINKWVSDKTNGKIKSIINNVPDNLNSVLVNTVYLKLNWKDTFNDAVEKKDWFTDINGEKQAKGVMTITEDFQYYEDKNCQMVSVPLSGEIKMAFVLGDSDKTLPEVLSKAKSQKVNISVPKFKIESEFNSGEIIKFYNSKGVNKAFSDTADFSTMLDGKPGDFFIGDVVHKTCVECQEEGIEAAAATAIIVTDSAMIIEKPVKPKEFTANKPFAFYIYSERYKENDYDNPIYDLIFYGQYVK